MSDFRAAVDEPAFDGPLLPEQEGDGCRDRRCSGNGSGPQQPSSRRPTAHRPIVGSGRVRPYPPLLSAWPRPLGLCTAISIRMQRVRPDFQSDSSARMRTVQSSPVAPALCASTPSCSAFDESTFLAGSGSAARTRKQAPFITLSTALEERSILPPCPRCARPSTPARDWRRDVREPVGRSRCSARGCRHCAGWAEPSTPGGILGEPRLRSWNCSDEFRPLD